MATIKDTEFTGKGKEEDLIGKDEAELRRVYQSDAADPESGTE